MKLKVKKLNSKAILPEYKIHGDAGLNLYSIKDVKMKAGERATIDTGIAVEIPNGYVGLIWDRSGMAQKFGIKVMGGVIDAGYRGDIGVGLLNTSKETYKIKAGDKVAQMLIQKVELVKVVEAKKLSESHRGDKRFGSTGR